MRHQMKPLACLIAFTALYVLSTSDAYCMAPHAGSPTERAQYHKVKGDELLKKGEVSHSISEYTKAIAFNPHSTATYFNLAIAYYSDRNLEGAASALEKLLELDPQDAEAHYNLACLRLYQREIGRAKAHFEKAKSCCDRNPRFGSLIEKGLAFVDDISQTDASTQDIVFFLLQYGLPPLPVPIVA